MPKTFVTKAKINDLLMICVCAYLPAELMWDLRVAHVQTLAKSAPATRVRVRGRGRGRGRGQGQVCGCIVQDVRLTSRDFGLIVGVQGGGDIVAWNVGVDAANGSAELSQVHFAQNDAVGLLVSINQGSAEWRSVPCRLNYTATAIPYIQ